MFFLLIASFLVLLVLGNPVELQQRGDGCNADNCLRQLRGPSSSLASSWCSTYYESLVTVTTTVTSPALYPTGGVFKRRNMETTAMRPIITASPVPEAELIKRQFATPSYVSKCTEEATALSSGCSCLLGSNATTRTFTQSFTTALPLPTECSESNEYGYSLGDTDLTYDTQTLFGPGPGEFSAVQFESLPGGCCAWCMSYPNCFIYYQWLYYNSSQGTPGFVNCVAEILGERPFGDPFVVDPTCAYEQATLTAYGTQTKLLFGAGPCATVSDYNVN